MNRKHPFNHKKKLFGIPKDAILWSPETSNCCQVDVVKIRLSLYEVVCCYSVVVVDDDDVSVDADDDYDAMMMSLLNTFKSHLFQGIPIYFESQMTSNGIKIIITYF